MRILYGVFLLSVTIVPTHAANLEPSADPAGKCMAIELSGNIEPGDYDRFSTALRKASEKGPVRRLYLNSGGGNLLSALAIAELLKGSDISVDTIVRPGQQCNSACFIIFAAGSRRMASPQSTLIVHQAYNQKTGKADAAATKEVGEYLVKLGMSVEVVTTMSSLDPNAQLSITPFNAGALGFASIIFYGGSKPPATPKCSWEGFIMKTPQ